MKKSILNAINAISSTEEMNEVIDLIKLKQKSLRSEAQRSVKATIMRGSKVTVNGQRANGVGTILDIKRTKAIVEINGERWNVPLTLIRAA
jgi:hypothetical protein